MKNTGSQKNKQENNKTETIDIHRQTKCCTEVCSPTGLLQNMSNITRQGHK